MLLLCEQRVERLPRIASTRRSDCEQDAYDMRREQEVTTLNYLAKLHRNSLCYSKSEEMPRGAIRLSLCYLKFWDVAVSV